MSRGKVVLVRFPFDDLRAGKVRPAVCLTDPVGIHRHLVLAFITSRFPDEMLETDLLIEPRHPSFAAIGLRVASTLRIHRLVTASASIVLRELGELPPDLQAEVGRKLRILFAL